MEKDAEKEEEEEEDDDDVDEDEGEVEKEEGTAVMPAIVRRSALLCSSARRSEEVGALRSWERALVTGDKAIEEEDEDVSDDIGDNDDGDVAVVAAFASLLDANGVYDDEEEEDGVSNNGFLGAMFTSSALSSSILDESCCMERDGPAMRSR